MSQPRYPLRHSAITPIGTLQESNPRPFRPKRKIIPLDQTSHDNCRIRTCADKSNDLAGRPINHSGKLSSNRACRELNPGLLSDSQVFSPTILQAHNLATEGLEPSTFSLLGQHSNRLSYAANTTIYYVTIIFSLHPLPPVGFEPTRRVATAHLKCAPLDHSGIVVNSHAGNRTPIAWMKTRYPNRWTT